VRGESMNREKRVVFVTVGSTKFDALVESVLSEDVMQRLRAKGFDRIVVQTGNSLVPREIVLQDEDGVFRGEAFGLQLQTWAFKPSLKEEYESAELVIGHAGKHSGQFGKAFAVALIVYMVLQAPGQLSRYYDLDER